MPDCSGAAVKSHAQLRLCSPARGQRARVRSGRKDLVDADLKGCRNLPRRQQDCARAGRRARAEVDVNGCGCLPQRNLPHPAMRAMAQSLLHEVSPPLAHIVLLVAARVPALALRDGCDSVAVSNK